MKLQKYSIGTGDRFGYQGKAQLKAITHAEKQGLDLAIVWNKSYREHQICKTKPEDVLKEAQEAVEALEWKGSYYIDADHINQNNYEIFVNSCNFFTIDVAEFIGKDSSEAEKRTFSTKYKKYIGKLKLPDYKEDLDITEDNLNEFLEKYLKAIKEAGRVYKLIKERKSTEEFITEISIDEAQNPQNPISLFFILGRIADENIPIQTIAPKFYGQFNKGIDYIGDLEQFEENFTQFIAILQFAKKEFDLPPNLKLSIHSGSDKFSIYPIINKIIKKFNVGLHLKTAGTTWLEEVIGLAMGGGEGLSIAKQIYSKAYERYEELSTPYINVIDIDYSKLPPPEIVNKWSGNEFADCLRRDPTNPVYNRNFRQLLHIGYKVAAEMKSRYLDALKKYEKEISENVTKNIYERHIKPVFL